MNNNELLNKIGIKIKPYQITVEIFCIAFLLIGVLLKNTDFGYIFIIIAMSILSMLYFLMSFVTDKSKSKPLIFLYKVIYLSMSVGAIGILYRIQHYPGWPIMLKASFFSLVIALAVKSILKFKSRDTERIFDFDSIRTVIMIFIITAFLI